MFFAYSCYSWFFKFFKKEQLAASMPAVFRLPLANFQSLIPGKGALPKGGELG
jgi:hypothetical protein